MAGGSPTLPCSSVAVFTTVFNLLIAFESALLTASSACWMLPVRTHSRALERTHLVTGALKRIAVCNIYAVFVRLCCWKNNNDDDLRVFMRVFVSSKLVYCRETRTTTRSCRTRKLWAQFTSIRQVSLRRGTYVPPPLQQHCCCCS